MKLKITSDGTPYGTKIINAETGEDLSISITSIMYEHKAGEFPTCKVQMMDNPVEFTVDGELKIKELTIEGKGIEVKK